MGGIGKADTGLGVIGVKRSRLSGCFMIVSHVSVSGPRMRSAHLGNPRCIIIGTVSFNAK